MHTVKSRLLVALALGATLLLQLQWSWQRLLAELQAAPALLQLERWSDADYDPGDREWQPVRAQLAAALGRMPEDPELLAAYGDLYTQRLSDNALTALQITGAEERGSNAYLRSLMQRPAWLRDWDDLALIRYNQQHYRSEDYQLALRQMARYGQHRSGMMELLRDLSGTSWDQLSPETQRIIDTVRGRFPAPTDAPG